MDFWIDSGWERFTADTCYTPQNKVLGGYTGIGLSVRPSVCPSVCPSVRRHNFVCASSPTVFIQFCWNFTGILPTIWSCAPAIFFLIYQILQELRHFEFFSYIEYIGNKFCVRFFFYSFYPILLKLYRNPFYYMKLCTCNFLFDLSTITGVMALWIFFIYRIYREQILCSLLLQQFLSKFNETL